MWRRSWGGDVWERWPALVLAAHVELANGGLELTRAPRGETDDAPATRREDVAVRGHSRKSPFEHRDQRLRQRNGSLLPVLRRTVAQLAVRLAHRTNHMQALSREIDRTSFERGCLSESDARIGKHGDELAIVNRHLIDEFADLVMSEVRM